MTIRTADELKNQFKQTDPFDHNNDMVDSFAAAGGFADVTAVAYDDANGTTTLVTVPANSLITTVEIVRTTAWDAVTTFEVGKSGDTDWLSTTAQASLTGAIPATEDAEAETMTVNKFVTSDTAIIWTYNAGAASQGAGYIRVRYVTFA